MRTILFYTLSLILLVVVGLASYRFIANFTYTRHITLPAHLLASTSTPSIDPNVLETPDVFGQTDPATLNPASSTLDTGSWKTYTNPELGFTIKYPADAIVNTDTPGSVVFFLPKDHYFTWPLLDEVKISIAASSSCPALLDGQSAVPASSSTQVLVNNYQFTRSQGSDAAAGNVYKELAYDTISQGICYHLSLFDHGANGAGLYVSDQSLMARYDQAHQANIDRVVAIFNALVQSFTRMLQ